MKVKELIKKLQAFPEDVLVVTRGYEGGYDDINDIEIINIIKDNVDEEGYKKIWFYGIYSKASGVDNQDNIEAVLLNYFE